MKKRSAGLLGALVALVASMAILVPVAQATTPAPGYERFAGCPSPSENPSTALCLRSVITSGHFQMGSKDVPIKNPITMVGGLNEEFAGFAANSKGGLSPVKQEVPGGVIGLTGLDWLVNFLNLEGLKLYAVTELVGVPTIGETLSLPIRVHLINPVLGNNCYVGSPSNPIKLNLTEGTTNPPPPNKPITGKQAENSFDAETEIITMKNAVAVDNSFAAPGASGCVLTLFGFIPISINGLVNSQSGLPSPAGTNETVQVLDTEITPVTRVYP
jgi:hypothetical protein